MTRDEIVGTLLRRLFLVIIPFWFVPWLDFFSGNTIPAFAPSSKIHESTALGAEGTVRIFFPRHLGLANRTTDDARHGKLH